MTDAAPTPATPATPTFRRVRRLQSTWKTAPGPDGAPPAHDFDGRPVVLTGPSGSGKSGITEGILLTLTGVLPLDAREEIRDPLMLAAGFGGKAEDRGAVVTDDRGGLWSWSAKGRKPETTAPAAAVPVAIGALIGALTSNADGAARALLSLAGVTTGAIWQRSDGTGRLPLGAEATLRTFPPEQDPADTAKALRAAANKAKGEAERAAAAHQTAQDLLTAATGEAAPPTVATCEAQLSALKLARVRWAGADGAADTLRRLVPGLDARKQALRVAEDAARLAGAALPPTTAAIAEALAAVGAELPPAHVHGGADCPMCARAWDLDALRARCAAAAAALARVQQATDTHRAAAELRSALDADIQACNAAVHTLSAAGVPVGLDKLPPAAYTPQIPKIDAAIQAATAALHRAQAATAQVASAAEWAAAQARTATAAAEALALADAWDAAVQAVAAETVARIQAAVAEEARACGVPASLIVDSKGVALRAPAGRLLSTGQYAVAVVCLARAVLALRTDDVLPFLHLPDVQVDRATMIQAARVWAARPGAPVWITTTNPIRAEDLPDCQIIDFWPGGAAAHIPAAVGGQPTAQGSAADEKPKRRRKVKAADAGPTTQAAAAPAEDPRPEPTGLEAPPDDTADDAADDAGPPATASARPVGLVPTPAAAKLAEWRRVWGGIPEAASVLPPDPDPVILNLLASLTPGQVLGLTVAQLRDALRPHGLAGQDDAAQDRATRKIVQDNPAWIQPDAASDNRVIWSVWARNFVRSVTGRSFCSETEWESIRMALDSSAAFARTAGATAAGAPAAGAPLAQRDVVAELDDLLRGLSL